MSIIRRWFNYYKYSVLKPKLQNEDEIGISEAIKNIESVHKETNDENISELKVKVGSPDFYNEDNENNFIPNDVEVNTADGKVFLSSDYFTVMIGNKKYDLSPNQSRIIEYLHEMNKTRFPSRKQEAILEELDINTKSIYKVFRSPNNTFVYNTLIKADGSGKYRLNTK